jgi:hypothetical protein
MSFESRRVYANLSGKFRCLLFEQDADPQNLPA